MSDALDAPTVYRQDSPTLGVAVMSLAHKAQDAPDPAYIAPIIRLANRVTALEADLWWLQQPWWVRLGVWIRARWILGRWRGPR